jgi:hypothetical protein
MSPSRCPPGFGPGAGWLVPAARLMRPGEPAFIARAVLVMPVLPAAIFPAPPITGIRASGRPAEDPPGPPGAGQLAPGERPAGTASRPDGLRAGGNFPAAEPHLRPASWPSARAADSRRGFRGRPGSAPDLSPGPDARRKLPGFRDPSGIAKLPGPWVLPGSRAGGASPGRAMAGVMGHVIDGDRYCRAPCRSIGERGPHRRRVQPGNRR